MTVEIKLFATASYICVAAIFYALRASLSQKIIDDNSYIDGYRNQYTKKRNKDLKISAAILCVAVSIVIYAVIYY